jgi:hypothetical protein
MDPEVLVHIDRLYPILTGALPHMISEDAAVTLDIAAYER